MLQAADRLPARSIGEPGRAHRAVEFASLAEVALALIRLAAAARSGPVAEATSCPVSGHGSPGTGTGTKETRWPTVIEARLARRRT